MQHVGKTFHLDGRWEARSFLRLPVQRERKGKMHKKSITILTTDGGNIDMSFRSLGKLHYKIQNTNQSHSGFCTKKATNDAKQMHNVWKDVEKALIAYEERIGPEVMTWTKELSMNNDMYVQLT